MVQVDSLAYALSIHKQIPLRITKGNNSNRIGPSPFLLTKNVHLVDIKVFAKFDEIPSLHVPDIKEKPKCRRQIKNYKGQ